MTKLQVILKEIDSLNKEEQAQLLNLLLNKISKMKHILSVLDEYKGKGAGIWNTDAQEHINQMRSDS